MIERICHIDKELEDSIFLFGARQTGKSTFLRQKFPDSIYIDLLDTTIKGRFSRRPSLLYEMLSNKEVGTLVIIDEIPEVPELLNEVHRLMSEKGLVFILCGSSARKLKRKGYNTLGGRAYPVYLFPFVSAEIPDFDLQQAINYGMLPPHYLAKNPHRRLSAYIDVYLKEEIKEEALVRNLNTFQRFLEVAALTDGENLVIQELRAWLSYKESMEQLSYWRAYTGQEVDAVIGDARVAIEIKSVEEVLPRHLKGLKTFASDYPESKLLIVSLDPINRKMGDVECIYIIDFFRRLWSEGI